MHLSRPTNGFTLIELLVVMTIIGLLLMLAVPRYFGGVDRAKEAVLRENLHQMRDAIDKYYADTLRYPTTLEDLVTRKYLRTVPADPITESRNSWVLVPPTDPSRGVIYDVKSGAKGSGRDGTPFSTW